VEHRCPLPDRRRLEFVAGLVPEPFQSGRESRRLMLRQG